ncbi:uncharacterized protein LOC9299202 [Arabidopsis lyrata subsp. lyrata]|uniref:uncharacterized protein LOC9299202 n=1 Tax=Arabidopsis lyrata subsp. lyrata TaxID=81972 RepID=UPI000A29CC90|nr:uncharacterized protein LOC9299202 [Arabidopsis lyrata subsp. lyrata]|eukprot:XP_020877008.1 uncharacterized protein LOC9299202 [Arabidopsis lyrata subsp. lyrata]
MSLFDLLRDSYYYMFPTDCLGSHFNTKKRMECPCCRRIEKGHWLLAKPVDPHPPFPYIDNTRFHLDIRDYMFQMSTRVGSDSTLLPPISTTLPPYVLNQVTNNRSMRIHHWGDTSLDRRMQRHERNERTVDRERRFHNMMYERHGRTGGSGYGGERSGREAVAEEVEAGEAAEGAEVTEE